ncbi:MAG: serine hydrolase [Candidatus Kapabacteria bacterium]|nr:serine hydrolase [Candidatus Kapabacteria bacterium]
MPIRTLCFSVALLFAPVLLFSQLYFPPVVGNTWETATPASLGWNTARIQPLYDFLQGENTKAFIVLKDGKIVLEQYFGTFTADSLWYWASAGKTVTAFLTGKAQEEGKLNISDRTSKYLGSGWTSLAPEKENLITIRHQLTMTTGLNDKGGNPDCTNDSCLKYLADAGTRWAYHNAPYTLLEKVVSTATGLTYNQYTRQKLLTPTGMNGTWLPVEDNNVFFSRPRSMARFGLLMLNNGVWDKTTVLADTQYIRAMTTTSQDLNKSYGYLWWLGGQESHMLPTLQMVFPGSYAPNAPADMVSALGKNGQILSISKSTGLVIIRMGDRPNSPSSEIATLLCDQIWQRLNEITGTASSVDGGTQQQPLVYPNPATTTLLFSGEMQNATIYDVTGNAVWSGMIGGGVAIDCSSWASGMYAVRSNARITTTIQILR